VKVKKDRVTRHGWEVVEKYISVQKGYNYAKTESFPVGCNRCGKEKSFS